MCVNDRHDMTLAVNPFPNKPWFLRVCCICLLKTLWVKEKLLVTSNFSFSHCFQPILRTFSLFFFQIHNCRLQTLSVSKGLKFVVWERVKVALNPNTTKLIILIRPYIKGKACTFVPIICEPRINPLPEDKILDWSKLKQIAFDTLKCI